MWTDGRTGGQPDTTKLIVFRNFAKAPNETGAFADNSEQSIRDSPYYYFGKFAL